MIKFGLILAVSAVLCSGRRDTRNTTLIGDEWDWVIQNFSGFNYWRRNDKWTISTDDNSTIKVLCLEMRLPARTDGVCNNGKLVFDDGLSQKTYCGRSEMVLYQGNSSQLKVNFVVQPDYAGRFWCKGKSVHPPRSYQTIDVNADANINFQYPEVLGKDRDQAFVFKSTSGSPISLSCIADMEPRVESGQCAQELLTIDSGTGPQVFCGRERASATGTVIKMRVETYQATNGHVRCVVQG